MDVVRRAMKGRTTLMKRIKERPDAEAWHARLKSSMMRWLDRMDRRPS